MKEVILGSVIFLLLVGSFLWIFVEVPLEISLKVPLEILLGLFAALMYAAVLLYLQYRKEKKEHQNWLLRNKEACLTEIFDIFTSLLQELGKENSSTEKIVEKTSNRMMRLQTAILIWGSASTLRAWEKTTQIFIKGGDGDPTDIPNVVESLFREVRKELGHNDKFLKDGELHSTLVVGVEEKKSFFKFF